MKHSPSITPHHHLSGMRKRIGRAKARKVVGWDKDNLITDGN